MRPSTSADPITSPRRVDARVASGDRAPHQERTKLKRESEVIQRGYLLGDALAGPVRDLLLFRRRHTPNLLPRNQLHPPDHEPRLFRR
jgi:hypothetical protein